MAAHTNVCVIGLGSMGMGAARACLQAGLNTWGVDINPDNCRALLAAGAKGAGPSAVPFAAELDAVVLLVVNAARAGIPLETMYDVVTHAAGNSWMFENRMQHVLDGDYSPKSAVDIFVKDLGLVNDTARALTFPLPLATTALNMFTSASNAGFGREDDSAVIKIFNGITLPGHKQ
ncbi:NAD-binding protein [Klebsiella pneumoniae]|nr:NAD-binding protein [Klebsiella pneumoniae]HDE1139555.1 NAD-binding protein [Klebsiella pneumoniae]HDE2541382.1 NAD-binding protein [Klebsiella pneumoniae]HDE2542449.1 NAD-binding protein [Klebsiella pneumoniae]